MKPEALHRLLPAVLLLPVVALAAPHVEAPPLPPVLLPHSAQDVRPDVNEVEVPAPSRGQLLYENHCLRCHESLVHIRTDRHVKTEAGLHAQVTRWSHEIGVRWSEEEIVDVARYLSARYYRFEP